MTTLESPVPEGGLGNQLCCILLPPGRIVHNATQTGGKASQEGVCNLTLEFNSERREEFLL